MPTAARVLVIIFGEFRGSHLAWNSLNTHVINHNQADLAFIGPQPSPQVRQAAQVLLQKVKYDWSVKEQDDWGEFLDKNVVTDAESGWRALCKHYAPSKRSWEIWHFLGGTKSCVPVLSGGILLAYRHIFYQHLVNDKLSDRYDWFIFTRTDYIYLCPPPRPSLLPRGRVYIPRGEGYGGYSDRFAIVPSDLAPTFFNLTNDVLRNWRYWDSLQGDKDFSGNIESVVRWYMTRMQIPVTLYCHPGFTVRTPDDPTSWKKNGTDEFPMKIEHNPDLARLNLTNKYSNEIAEAEQACSPWRRFRHWSSHVGEVSSGGSSNRSSNSGSNSGEDSTRGAEVTDLLSLNSVNNVNNEHLPDQQAPTYSPLPSTVNPSQTPTHQGGRTLGGTGTEGEVEGKTGAGSGAGLGPKKGAGSNAGGGTKAEAENGRSTRRQLLATQHKSTGGGRSHQSKSKNKKPVSAPVPAPTRAPSHLVREVC
jgi:hypothetical protein